MVKLNWWTRWTEPDQIGLYWSARAEIVLSLNTNGGEKNSTELSIFADIPILTATRLKVNVYYCASPLRSLSKPALTHQAPVMGPLAVCCDAWAYCRSYYLSMPWDVCGILWPASVQSLWYGGPHDVVLGAWWVASSTNTSKLLLVRWSMLFTSPVSSLKAYVMVQSVGLKHALSLTNKQNNPTEECCLLYMAFHIYLHISVL